MSCRPRLKFGIGGWGLAINAARMSASAGKRRAIDENVGTSALACIWLDETRWQLEHHVSARALPRPALPGC